MPADHSTAANWWIDLQEPPKPDDKPREVQVKGKEGTTRLVFPYIERITATLKAYLRAEPSLQSLVISAKEDDIYWRGDDEDSFMLICAETMKWRDMSTEQKKAYAKEKLKQVAMF